MRDCTEWPEELNAETVRLIGTERQRIIDEVAELINNHLNQEEKLMAINPYIHGEASQRIVSAHLSDIYTINWILSTLILY